MSLLRLLTTGKSLVGVNETESRYRLTRQRLLPHFGSARNPFRNSGRSDPVQAEMASPASHRGDDASEDKRSIPILGGKPVAASSGVAEDRTMSASAIGHRYVEGLRLRTSALLNGFKARLSGLPGRASGKAAKSAIPRFTKQSVQAELSLEKIKVVRNDLSDADLEVVPGRQPTVPASATPGVRTEERAGVRVGNWGRVSARMFGAGKT